MGGRRISFGILVSCIGTEYGDLQNKSPYLVETRENADQKISEYGHFSRSDVTK